MEEDKIKRIYEILNNISVTKNNKETIEEIKKQLLNKDYLEAFKKIDELNKIQKGEKKVEKIEEEQKVLESELEKTSKKKEKVVKAKTTETKKKTKKTTEKKNKKET